MLFSDQPVGIDRGAVHAPCEECLLGGQLHFEEQLAHARPAPSRWLVNAQAPKQAAHAGSAAGPYRFLVAFCADIALIGIASSKF